MRKAFIAVVIFFLSLIVLNTLIKIVDKQKTQIKGIPILMYHSISYEKFNPLRVPADKFDQQMKYLKDNGYTPISLDELYNFLSSSKSIPSKAVVITFDDGYVDNYTNAYPILKKYGFKATIFVITDMSKQGGVYLNRAELIEMQKNGIDIESHTENHEMLSNLSYSKQIASLKSSKEYLENVLNKKVCYIAYPYGKYNDLTLKAAYECDYKLAFTTKSEFVNRNSEKYELGRIFIDSFEGLEEFKNKLKLARLFTK